MPAGAPRWSSRAPLAAALAVLAAAPIAMGVISSGTTGFNGLHLNFYLGADTWYNQGYTGTRAVVANIEGGQVWNGHIVLSHVSTYIQGPGVPDAPPAWFPAGTPNFDRHATQVGHVLAGRTAPENPNPSLHRGMAYGAELWSGAVAVQMAGNGFNTTFNSVLDTYQIALLDGVGGRTADVVNSSWGRTGSNQNGSATRVRAIDNLIYRTGKVVVFAAGNSGPTSGSVLDPAIAKNDITVGALGNQFGAPPYNTIAGFSSRGPQAYALPTSPLSANNIVGVRAPIDICAPGEDFTMALYDGASGGNANAGFNNTINNAWVFNTDGTSFAAPTVAGFATLMTDAAKDRGFARGTDGRVIRSVLMTSADKTQGWTNNRVTIGPTATTTQGVDWVFGAGRVNMSRAASTFLQGTTDLQGLTGGAVQDTGWDFGQVAEFTPNSYTFAAPLLAGSSFTATLSWWANDFYDPATRLESSVQWGNQDNLDLILYQLLDDGTELPVYQSISKYNLNEHISWTIPVTAQYVMRVQFTGVIYDFLNGPASEPYALSWDATTIPAPAAAVLLALAVLPSRRRRPVS
jgi:hypothetical protein